MVQALYYILYSLYKCGCYCTTVYSTVPIWVFPFCTDPLAVDKPNTFLSQAWLMLSSHIIHFVLRWFTLMRSASRVLAKKKTNCQSCLPYSNILYQTLSRNELIFIKFYIPIGYVRRKKLKFCRYCIW